MAKAKKNASKTQGKKSSASKPKASRRGKAPVPALSDAERLSAVKPPPDYTDILEQFLPIWETHKRFIRSGDTSPAQLRARLRKSDAAWKKEQALERKQAEQMRPVRDARVRAESATWSTFLNVWDIVKAVADDHPEIADATSSVREALTTRGKKPDAKAGGTPAANG
jgi:hypothetical protein